MSRLEPEAIVDDASSGNSSLKEGGEPSACAELASRSTGCGTVDEGLPLVLHVRVVTGHGGGPEKTILNSPRFLPPLGYRAALAYLHPPQDPGFALLKQRAEAAGAELISIPDRGPADVSVIWHLARLCRQRRVAIWHGHDYKSNALGLLIRRLWRMRLVTTLHGWTNLSGRVPLYVRIDKWCLPRYEAAICVSEDLVAQCHALGLPANRVHLVHNAIDTRDYARRRPPSEAKRAWGLDEDALLVGAVGRLSEEKGFDLLIRAVHRLRQQGLPVVLWIAGEGPARPALERLIGELGAATYVRLLGHLADPRGLYEALDLFVLSSYREGLPNVVLEAMALQAPVLATRVAGVPSLVEDGRSGLIVPPGDLPALVRAMERLLADPALRLSLAEEARRRVQTDFSFDRRMAKVAQIYDRLLARPSAAPAGTPSVHGDGS
jgi:glycosyltransferase involved in cell wall biosynthesis